MEAYMNDEIRLENVGVFPTYLNLASSSTKFQIHDEASVRLVDFSSCNTTYIVKQDPIPVKQYVSYH
jgi:hypothetical protein